MKVEVQLRTAKGISISILQTVVEGWMSNKIKKKKNRKVSINFQSVVNYPSISHICKI